MSRVRRRNSATKSCRDGTGRAPRPLPAPKGSRGDRGCPCVPVALVAFLLASLASVQPGSAFTWVADGAAVLPQQGPLFYEAAIAQLANQANLSTDPVAAAQYFLNPNQTDANGCTTIVTAVERVFGADALPKLSDILPLGQKFTDSTLQPLGLSFTPAYIILHASADPPANLASYGGYDTYGDVTLSCNSTLSAPLTSDLIDVARNLVLSQLRTAGYAVDGLIVGLNFPNGFTNSEPLHTPFMTTFIDADIMISGPDIVPFGPERQSLLLSTLLNIMQTQTQPVSTIDVIGLETVAAAPPPGSPPGAGSPPPSSPVSNSRRQLRQVVSSANQSVRLTIRNALSNITPAGGTTAPALWGKTLSPGSNYSSLLAAGGMPGISLTYLNSTLFVRQNTPQATVFNLTYDPPSQQGPRQLVTWTDASAPPDSAATATPTAPNTGADGSAQGTVSPRGTADATDSQPGNTSTGLIVGISIAAAVVVVLAGIVLCLYWRRRKRRSVVAEAEAEKTDAESGDSGKETHSSANSFHSAVPAMTLRDSYGMLLKDGEMPDSRAHRIALTMAVRSRSLQGSTEGSVTTSRKSWPLGTQEIDPSEIHICEQEDGRPWLLGSGSFGQVFKGVRRQVQEVAVKKLLPGAADDSWWRQMQKEIGVLQKVSYDRNIVQYYGACLAAEQPMLIMEYMAGGDLRHALNWDDADDLAWDKRGRGIMLDVARGLHFLHSTGVVHRDLKTSNILLSQEGVAKIGDVGLAKILSDVDQASTHMVAGTFAYAAPELILGWSCSDRVDIYSFGVVLWELVTKELPRRGALRRVHVPGDCPEAIAQLIDDCMHSDPADRPSAAQVFHRIAKTADASQIIKPLASRSAASSFESGRLGTASDPSVRSVLGVDAATQLTAQAISTDADSDAEAHAHDADLPAEEADSPPGTDTGHADLPAEQVHSPVGNDQQPVHQADQGAAGAAVAVEAAHAIDPRADQADPRTNDADLGAPADEEPAEAARPAGVEAGPNEDVS